MKRVISILMILVFALGVVSCASANSIQEEGEFAIPMTSSFNESLNYTTTKWMASSESRGYLTWTLMMDLVNETNGKISVEEYNPMIESAVGSAMGGICVCIKSNDSNFLIIAYFPSSDTATYTIMGPGKATARYALELMQMDTYSNNGSELLEILQTIMGD